jgi:hypothetical protein
MKGTTNRALSVLKWLSFLVAAVIVGREYFKLREQSKVDRVTIDELAASVERLEQRPPSVMRIVEGGPRARQAPSGFNDPGNVVTPPEPANPAPGPVAPKGEKIEVIAARFAAAYGDERTDTGWADQTKRDLRATVASLGVDRNIESLECHSSLCRIQSTFTDQSEYNHFMDELAGKVAGGDGMISPDLQRADNGSLHVLSYWVRAGRMAELTTGVSPVPGPTAP